MTNSDAPSRTEGGETARRALRLLEVVVTAQEPIGLNDLARRVGLSKSTCYRLLRVLQDELYVDRVEPGGYRVGTSLVALSATVLSQAALYQAARPALHALASASGETATLHVRSGDRAVLVLGVESTEQVLRRAATVGETTWLGRGSSGWAILAHLESAEAERIVGRSEQPEALRSALGEVRRLGYAISFGANHPGVHGIAAPVMSSFTTSSGELSVALSGPAERWTEDRMLQFADLLLQTCADLAGLFGPADAGVTT
jgi:DNA-binding IclR family transcriptional regulator